MAGPRGAGLHLSEHYTAADDERVILTHEDATGRTSRMVEVLVAPAGQPAQFTVGDSEPTQPVGIGRAYWLRQPQAIYQYQGVRLAFEWEPSAWATSRR